MPCVRVWCMKSRCLLLGLVLCMGSIACADGTRTVVHPLNKTIQHPSRPARPLNQVVARLRAGMDVSTFSVLTGSRLVRQFVSDPQIGVFAPPTGVAIADFVVALKKNPNAEFAVQDCIHYRVPAFVPNDAYYTPFVAGTTNMPGQWFFKNAFVAGRDINIEPAWAANATGTGVKIGIVDDGLDTGHPDLSPNFTSSDSFNWENSSFDPSHGYAVEGHGTCVAGLAGARGGNSIGVTGAAPFAQLCGLRVGLYADYWASPDSDLADAVMYHSSGANTNIKIKNHSYAQPDVYYPDFLDYAAITTSSAAGTIHVFASGDSRADLAEDSAKQQVLNNPDCIVVGSQGSLGIYADYSNFGPNLCCVTGSGSSLGAQYPVTTTDRTGADGYNPLLVDPLTNLDYTTQFSGTSASAPVVSGVAALAKQVQPALNARFFKHLLARTCKVIHSGDLSYGSDKGWRTNGGGFKFNQNYGWGLLDASALVTQAQNYSGVTSQTVVDSGVLNVSLAIPNESTAGLTRTVSMTGMTQPLETVSVTMSALHTYRGDLICYLTSPSGYKSRLFSDNDLDNGQDLDWTFSTNAFWGESGNGTWTLNIQDIGPGGTGGLINWDLTLRGGTLVQAKTISGTVNLTSRVAGASNLPTTVQVFNPGSTSSPLRTYNVTPTGAGVYSVSTDLPNGTYDITFKDRPFLRTRVANVVIGSSGVSGVNPTLVPGDITDDNTVNLSDFSKLSTYYGLSSSASNWLTTDSQGVRPFDCDLNGDGTVNLVDFSSLSSNYGLTGSN